MNELPRALAPWAEHLDLLPRELALAFGPLVARLDALIGTLHRAPRWGMTNPDGFDGLARRGSYERLLLSEWLLADEAPDEFLRRAATGEHAFHRLAHRDPAASRLCVALFDAEANQLGSPRLAHLAALIVLARRAQSAHARFAWGVLQKPGTLHESVSAATIRAWLGERVAPEADRDHIAQWRLHLEQWVGAPASDSNMEMQLWAIGGRRLQRLGKELTTRLIVSDVLEPDVRQVAIEVQEKDKVLRQAFLELPAEASCGRLLRDPFAQATSEVRRGPRETAPISNLMWTANGGKLLARGAGGALIVWSVPNGPLAGKSKPKLYRPDLPGEIIAAGRIRKTIVIVTRRDENKIAIQSFGKKSSILPRGDFELKTALPEGDQFPLLPCLQAPHSNWMTICLPHQRVARILCDGKSGSSQLLMETGKGAIAASQFFERLIHVPARGGEYALVAGRASGEPGDRKSHVLPGAPRTAFHGYSPDLNHPVFGLWALELEDGQWHIVSKLDDAALTAPAGARVIGVIGLGYRWPTPGLVVIEADNRTISLVGRDWTHSLPPAPETIEHASVSPALPDIAYTTQSGAVAVYSLHHDTFLMRFETSATLQ